MNKVAINVQESGAISILMNNMGLPDLLKKGFRGHLKSLIRFLGTIQKVDQQATGSDEAKPYEVIN